MKLQTAGQNGYRQLLRVGGCQQEFDVRRRLFQRFQQRIEAVTREHVHFVNQVNLEAAAGGCVLDVIQQIAGIFHLGSGRGVDLDQINKAPLLNLAAVVALTARRGGDAGFTVQAFGQQARNGGFTHAARAREQIGVMNPPQREAVSQRSQDMFLSDNICKRLRAPLTGKNLIAH
ncbi:hypothetical protein D3C80_927320 [compost metagenome]